jgi:hypothetical protein
MKDLQNRLTLLSECVESVDFFMPIGGATRDIRLLRELHPEAREENAFTRC